MSRKTSLTIPCWYVEWSYGGTYPVWRIFYSDSGQTLENALAWIEEKKAEPKVKSVKLFTGVHKPGIAWPVLDKIPIKVVSI